MAIRARAVDDAFEVLARLLARDLDEAERRDVDDVGLRAVEAHAVAQEGEEPFLLLVGVHVDEVDEDDAADVSEADLLQDFRRCFEIRAVDGVAEVRIADVTSRVHVDGGQRFRLVDDDGATRGQHDLALAETLDLLLDGIAAEERLALFVEMNPFLQFGRYGIDELRYTTVGVGIVDVEGVDLFREGVAHEAHDEVSVAVEKRGSLRHLVLRLQGLPETHEAIDVLLEAFFGLPVRRRADDQPHALGTDVRSDFLQPRTFSLALDAA